ncbi:uncharacterized protein LOC122818011 [Drosophila biarmipes]|uniref:uncharacterized protein LOC122818011 n=1 Tax=Drosophila biarmipes TaxID=125945 RepID=UPI001CDB2CB3|nr:uncharacterized protein LOC122818011 [Drosophila biarmipes]
MDDTMEQMVEDYFEMESFGVKLAPQVAVSDDARAQRILEDTTLKVVRHYQTGLLWKDDYAVLPRSYEMAHRRLINVEKKLKRNGQLVLKHDRIIKEYVSNGYARKLQQDEVAVTSDRLWYLPHFVENPNKPGKVRLVFDAAAKVGGTSLNSALDKGPQHYKPLPAVLFHFREGAVGFCGDIKDPPSADPTRGSVFPTIPLERWQRRSRPGCVRDERNDGAACSPSATHYVKTVNALKFRDSDPREVKAIIDHHYVDDYVDSFATESEAISVSTRVKEIHAEAGFELCQFSSSSPIVEADVKRDLGQKIQWDEPLPEEIGKASSAWCGEMNAVGQFRSPCHYFGHGAVRTIELHVFDASQSAFAAVAYWRVMCEDDNVLVSFVCAKTKCAPMRTISIPRLELQAAVLGTRLMNTVKEEHSVDISETVLWMDSKSADDATRSQNKANRSPESRWLSGPAFLRQTESGWPAPEEELVRITAWVLRFARWCRKQRSELEEYGLTARECEAAENLLVRQAQLESFPDEMRSAECGKNVVSTREIRGLAPYMDEHGVLRVYGMPHCACPTVHMKHHATIALIRTRFWFTKMRRVLKEVISSCNECKLQRTRPMPPIMGPLPEDRLEAGGWPFKYTGLDYFGPLLVTVFRHREKRWVALFTCLTTRAIHLELAHILSRRV